jgi:hypothetical protein
MRLRDLAPGVGHCRKLVECPDLVGCSGAAACPRLARCCQSDRDECALGRLVIVEINGQETEYEGQLGATGIDGEACLQGVEGLDKIVIRQMGPCDFEIDSAYRRKALSSVSPDDFEEQRQRFACSPDLCQQFCPREIRLDALARKVRAPGPGAQHTLEGLASGGGASCSFACMGVRQTDLGEMACIGRLLSHDDRKKATVRDGGSIPSASADREGGRPFEGAGVLRISREQAIKRDLCLLHARGAE